MAAPRVLVLRAPGTNCDQETAFAFSQAGALSDSLHVNRLLENPKLLRDFQIVCLPGGFSYGDDIAAGRILANQIRHHLRQALVEFIAEDKLVLGICNGFQILINTGLIIEDRSDGTPAATLTNNDSGKFEDRWVQLAVGKGPCVFLRGIERMYLPVAHGEGKFVVHSKEFAASLERAGQLPLRYASSTGKVDFVAYPDNPNGAELNVAGACDATGRVFGLMPHPERHIDATHHPRWTRGEAGAEGDGMAIFRNAVGYFS